MLSGSSWAGPDWEVVETPAGPTIHWDGARTAPGTEEVSASPPSADTFINSAAPDDASAGVGPILYVGNGDWQGSPSESQGLLQFDVSDVSHDVSQATVTLTPDAWRVGSESHAAEAIFDHAWDETTTWVTQPDLASASPIPLTSGEVTWTIASGDTTPIQLDVTRQVRRTLRRADLNFDGVRGAAGVRDDVAAFELAMQDPTAFDTAFAPAIVDDRDLLDRADLNDDGVINRDDAPSFLAAHGFQPGDLDFDGTVGLADVSRLQRRLGQDASYTQGDVDFSGHVDRRDAALWIASFGRTPPTAAEDKLSMRIYATDYLPGDSPYVGYVSKDNLSTPDKHPQLNVIQVVGDPYEQVTFGPARPIDHVPEGATPAHQAIAVDGAGTSIHAWVTDATSTPSIVAQQFDDRGDPLGEPFTIIAGDGVTDARVAAGASGDFVVAWRGPDTSGSTAVFYRRYRMIGTAPVAGETVQVTDSNLSPNNRYASVTLNDDRTVAFLWQGATVGSAGETDVYFRAFDAEDQPAAASPVVVHETVVTSERQPAHSGGGIATLPGERFAVVWTDGRQLQLRRFDADGSAVTGSEEILGSAATIDGTLIGGAKAVSSVTGDLSVAWWQQSPSAQPDESPETTIRMRRFDVASGSWLPAATLVDFRSPFWQSDFDAVDVDDLHIAADPFGSLGVAWQQSRAGSPTTTFVQWFSRDGQPITAPTVVSSSGSSRVTGMASGTGGRFLVGWNTEETTYARTIRLPWTPQAKIAAPTLLDVPEQVVAIGGTFTADLQASYPGGDLDEVLMELAESNPTGVSLVADPSAAGRATLEWSPTSGTPEGLHLIQLNVSDSAIPERQSRVVVQVTVGQPNQAPILVAVDRQQAIVDQPFVLQFEATDPDAPDFDLRYQFGNDAPLGARINRVTGLLQWEPASTDVGTRTFEITVHDQGRPNLATTVTVTIDVLAANIGPTITAPDIVPIDEDLPFQFTTGGTSLGVADPDSQATQLQLTLVATDGQFTLENTDGLQLVVGDSVSGPTALATIRGTAGTLNGALDGLTFQPNTNFHGTATLRLELNDLGNGGLQPALSASHSIALPVAPAIDLPTLAPQTFTLPSWFLPSDVAGTVVAGDPDPDQLLRYEVTAGNSDQALAIHVVTGTISVANEEVLSPGDIRVLTVRVFYAAAPAFLAEAPITIQIAPNSNRAPSIGWDNYTLDEDATITGNLMLGDSQGGVADTDPDGDPLVLVEASNQEGHSLPLGEANRLSSGAMLTLLADGSITYDASSSDRFNEKYFGTSLDRFTYTIADSYG
ncbi:MAG: Ig-like domain-containing protein, partial [Pirellulales bacterium]